MSDDNRNRSSGEWTKFGILVIVMVGVVLVVGSSRTFLFERIVPIVLGDHESPAPSPVELTPPVLEAPEPAYPVEQVVEPAYPVEPATVEPEVEEVVAPVEDVAPTIIEAAPPPPSYPGPETAAAESEFAQAEEAAPVSQGETSFAAASISAGTPTVYIVRTGDTLIGIAEQHNVAVSDLAAANGLTNPNRIKIGDSLTIPSP